MSRMRSCPCCGAPVEAETALDLACRTVSHNMALIVRLVARRPGIRLAEIADEVYRNDPDGGPIWAKQSISSTIINQKSRLAKYGVHLVYADATAQSGFMVVFDAPVAA